MKKKGRIEFIIVVGVVALTLVVATLQILFDVPIVQYCYALVRPSGKEVTAVFDNGVQRAAGDVTIRNYPSLIVQRGIPVEFTLNAVPNQIDHCNEYMSVPDFGIIDMQIVPGANMICFTPQESGIFYYDCRTGNMRTTITVVESLGFPDPNELSAPAPDEHAG